MSNHYSALVNVKSTLNTRQAPRQHISKIGKRPQSSKPIQTGLKKLDNDLVQGDKFSEQRETFKRVANVKKGGTDCNQPETYKLSKKLTNNKTAKKSTFADEEHLKHLKSL